MKICVICEGCYPFVAGGVSSWLHDLILSSPQHRFIIWAVGTNERQAETYAYPLPENVEAVRAVFLDTLLHKPQRVLSGRMRMEEGERRAMRQLLGCGTPDWRVIFQLFARQDGRFQSFLSSRDFLALLQEVYEERGMTQGFNDFFWTVRSMFLPLFCMMDTEPPEADLYHAVSAGYAGVLGAWAAQRYHKPYVLTEHGIYTREREEEIIRTGWVPQPFKDLWIAMFYMYTRCAYDAADVVTSLFGRASLIQQEIGCAQGKCRVIPNGIKLEQFERIPAKTPDGYTDIGAVVRLAPIKDIKTMLYAFAHVCERTDRVRLHVIGPTTEDPQYYAECVQLAQELGLPNVVFTGRVDVRQYMARVDFTLLTSISEGQPLAILEGMAARRPAVATDVGSCRELIEGVGDRFGAAGLCVPVMHQDAIAQAILQLHENPALCRAMGENGYRRVCESYHHDVMLLRYWETYEIASQG